MNLNQLKWRSRRSMLELDLIFDKFIQNEGLSQLSIEELSLYTKLLEQDDSDLQLMFQGFTSRETEMFAPLVYKIVQSSRNIKF
jgi:succinate dehydrogenase flavin-adding protein (antitoxin of CptAB toxin-antitoxin module)